MRRPVRSWLIFTVVPFVGRLSVPRVHSFTTNGQHQRRVYFLHRRRGLE
jgi:hypothetical protein